MSDLYTVGDFHRLGLPRATLKLRDLVYLVRVALHHEEITLSRAAELLGMGVAEMRALANHWAHPTHQD